MKVVKLAVFVLVLLVVPMVCRAELPWLQASAAIQLGITPQLGVIQYQPEGWEILQWAVGYTQLEAEVVFFRHLFAGGSVRTYITATDTWLNWSPNTTVYDWRVGLRWPMLELGWWHRCFHPTIPYQPVFDQVVTGVEGAFDELYLRLEIGR